MRRYSSTLLPWALLLGACASQSPVLPISNVVLDSTVQDAVARREQLAQQAETSGDLAQAAAQWQVLTLLMPDEERYRKRLAASRTAIARAAAEHLQQGYAAQRKGDMDGATVAMLKVLALTPENQDAARVLREIERQRIVKIQAERAPRYRLDTGTPAARVARPAEKTSEGASGYELEQSLELFNAGDTVGGLRDMRRYVDANPRDTTGRQRLSEAVYLRARQLDEQGAQERALPLYEQAIALRGDPPAVWATKAQTIRRALATDYYEKALRIYGSDLATAIRYLEASLRYEPAHTGAALKLQEARRLQDKLRQLDRSPPRR